MKLKKILLYATPVVLAGFLYLGESTGVGTVLAKTIRTRVTISTQGLESMGGGAFLDAKVTGTALFLTEVSEILDDKSPYTIKPIATTLAWLRLLTDSDKYPEGCVTVAVDVTADGTVSKTDVTRYLYHMYDAFAVTETDIEVPDDSSSESSKVVPTVDPEAAEAARREQEREQEKQREEAAVKLQKEAEQQVEDFYKTIQKAINKARSESHAASGSAGTAMIKTTYFTCFTQKMMDLLIQNSDLNYEIHYRYKGKNYVLVIPAGADYSKLKASNGYYGFRYLSGVFSGYEVK